MTSHRNHLLLAAGCLLMASGSWGFQLLLKQQAFPSRARELLRHKGLSQPTRSNTWKSSSSRVLLLTPPTSLGYRASDIPDEVTVDDEDLHDTIEDMASFLTLRVGMAMLRRQQLKIKQEQGVEPLLKASTSSTQDRHQVASQPPAEEMDRDTHSLLHKKEGDRILALGDEFSVGEEASSVRDNDKTFTAVVPGIPSCISTGFGQPLGVIQDDVLALQIPLAQVQLESDNPPALDDDSSVQVAPIDNAFEIIAAPVEEVGTSSPNESVASRAVDSALSVKAKKSAESKQRALLMARLEQEQFKRKQQEQGLDILLKASTISTLQDKPLQENVLQEKPLPVKEMDASSVRDNNKTFVAVVPDAPDVPSCISTDFGKPLDVIQDDILALQFPPAQV
jgi:hypothetical protein